ncbi:50S ribosomal protein L11 methyltransferase [Thermophagus sp. OGC60D27]|uniref:50S ribosomal protein L11 methyltransferase n=1 Tax=Thermophagus sp. OGC60D27 TaxID=3458415 RepID=UPI004037729E
MDFIQTTIQITPTDATAREILIAQLCELGYDSFMETDTGLIAYIPSEKHCPLGPENLPFLSSPDYRFSISWEKMKNKNWNKEWEQNYFKPVVIANQCIIRSPFHEVSEQKVPYEILIQPQMSFGTGHHETTTLMIQHLLEMDLTNLKVLDMGCGTGILAILASLKGAAHITAIDIDQWATNNAKDNINLNHISNITVEQGNADLLSSDNHFHIILANINRNILLQDLPSYDKALTNNGLVILSGFYKDDFEKLNAMALSLGWEHLSLKEQNNWIALSYRKK